MEQIYFQAGQAGTLGGSLGMVEQIHVQAGQESTLADGGKMLQVGLGVAGSGQTECL